MKTEVVQLVRDGSSAGFGIRVGTGEVAGETVTAVKFKNDQVGYYPAEQVDTTGYEAKIEVSDPGGAETVEQAACAIVDWLRGDPGPIHVTVTTYGGPKFSVEVQVGADDRAEAVSVSSL